MAALTLEEFAGRAEQAARAVAGIDWQPAIAAVLEDLEVSVEACFDESHDPDGRPWKELDIPFRRPLWGKARQMIQRVLASHRRASRTRTGFRIEVDSDVAALHNLGLKKRPVREFLGFGEAGLARAEEVVADVGMATVLKEWELDRAADERMARTLGEFD